MSLFYSNHQTKNIFRKILIGIEDFNTKLLYYNQEIEEVE